MNEKSKKLRTFLPLIIFLCLVIFLWVGLYRDPHTIPSPLVGKPVPEFRAADLEFPNQFITNNIFKDKITLLNVFATWCLSCRYEHPTLIDVHHANLVNIVGLNYKDNNQAAIKWLQQYGNPFSHVIEDPTGNIGINLGVYGTPETFIIDRNGIIRYKFIGPISPDDWQNTLLPIIQKLLSQNN